MLMAIAIATLACYSIALPVVAHVPRNAPLTLPSHDFNSQIAKKLGFKSGMTVCAINVPENYGDLLGALPKDVNWAHDLESPRDLIHLFVTEEDRLIGILSKASQAIQSGGTLWISWPKKASGMPTDLTRGVIRELCLPFGLVATKGCIVDAVWSALKFEVRNELR